MARYTKRFIVLAALGGVAAMGALAAGGLYLAARAGEQWEPSVPVVAPVPNPGATPAGALVLFDGRELSEWVSSRSKGPAGWQMASGVLTVNKASGNIETRRRFRNYQLHIEWRVPANITGSGQGRGNSGVFLAATGSGDTGYEVQILDSWRNPTYVNGQAGAIYKQFPPLANPARPPGEWQSYDITWTAPRFAADSSLQAPARVTLLFNGVLVQDDVALLGETRFIGRPVYKPHGAARIMLQAHADPSEPVSFRNIWLKQLP